MHFTGYGKQGQVNVLLTSIGLCVAELSHAKFSYSGLRAFRIRHFVCFNLATFGSWVMRRR